MTAETLRRAAALMRQRAEAATAAPEPWALTEGGTAIRARNGLGPTVAATIPLGYEERRANAQHIASWHPAVALAVAEWLEATAERVDAGRDPKDGGRRNHGWRGSRQALTVALAYLGEIQPFRPESGDA